MSKQRPDQPPADGGSVPDAAAQTSEQLRQRIRQLEEQLCHRQARADAADTAAQADDRPTAPPPEADGLAEGLVVALGRLVPGLGSLIQLAAQSPQFHERLAEIDEQIKRKFKDQPLRRASQGFLRGGLRRQLGVSGRLGIPPAVRRSSVRPGDAGSEGGPGSQGSGAGPGTAGRGKRRSRRQSARGGAAPGGPKVHIRPETPAQLPVDCFDEGRRIVVLAEAPGLTLDQITVARDGTVLLIAVEAAHRSSVQRVELPCEVAGEPDVSLANGILRIQARKAGRR